MLPKIKEENLSYMPSILGNSWETMKRESLTQLHLLLDVQVAQMFNSAEEAQKHYEEEISSLKKQLQSEKKKYEELEKEYMCLKNEYDIFLNERALKVEACFDCNVRVCAKKKKTTDKWGGGLFSSMSQPISPLQKEGSNLGEWVGLSESDASDDITIGKGADANEENKQDKPHECPKCHEKFKKKQNLENHILSCIHGKYRFTCTFDGCDKKFNRQIHYDNHVRSVHTGQHFFKLQKYLFVYINLFITHTRGETPFECSKCSTSFSLKRELVNHMATCVASKKKCTTCGKSFKSEEFLLKHTCSKISRPFQCTSCSKSFSTNLKLTRHMNSHNSSKPFSCETCHKKFSTAAKCNSHKQLKHPTVFTCVVQAEVVKK
ncbi:zinc finger protein [Reticulomyxa filosa]|uniref:Zinc finger protein n=1 Tax=Reticulomyxa filosa TaxID=46433 RepID=X6N2A5_RETFI|nr:zinc finger protein [Reticulomyxa filosa]|eukprot:ETO19432.1 zinc finger protein [Reticulomyxa filosa]